MAPRKRSVALAVLATLALLTGGLFVRRYLVRRAHVRAVAAHFPSFTLVGAARSLTAEVAPGCLVVASVNGGAVELRYPGGGGHGDSPLLACLCEAGSVTASSADDTVVLLRAEADAVGGSRAFSADSFGARTLVTADRACAENEFDGWLDTTHFRSPPAPGPVEKGVRPLVNVDSGFAVAEVPAESCVIVQGTAKLRLRGGSLAIPDGEGDGVWCTSSAAVVTLRSGRGRASMIPAQLVGGTMGVIETVPGVLRGATNDHEWNARALLVASAIPPASVTSWPSPNFGSSGDPKARIVAISTDFYSALGLDPGDHLASYCEDAVCMFSGAQHWKTSHFVDGALARATIPAWLAGLEDAREVPALKVGVQLLELARRLRRERFLPTTAGFTELDTGVDVLGLATEDAVVAVSILPAAPWIVTYGDATSWELGDEPRAMRIAPLDHVRLTTKLRLPPKAQRHTIVFRRVFGP